MGDVIVRKATQSEIGKIQELSNELAASGLQFDHEINRNWAHTKTGEKHYKKRLSGRDCICFVALKNDEIVGYASGKKCEDVEWRLITIFELENIYVREQYRRKGLGEVLVKKFITWAREKGAKRVELSPYYHNKKAIAFYKKLGFEPYDLTLELKLK